MGLGEVLSCCLDVVGAVVEKVVENSGGSGVLVCCIFKLASLAVKGAFKEEIDVPVVYENGTINSTTTTRPEDLNTAQVEWLDPNLQTILGVTKVPKKRLTKNLDPASFFRTGDVVTANRDLTSAGSPICKQGELGTLKERDGTLWCVSWWVSGKIVRVPQVDLTKCNPLEYIIANDIVKTKVDVTLPNNKIVSTGTQGTVKDVSQTSGKDLLVHWEGLGEQSYVGNDAVTKLAPMEYKLVGDVVKAKRVIKIGTKRVSNGALGTLKAYRASDQTWLVLWERDIGELDAVDDTLKKCDPMDFWRHGDFLKTTKDITCGNVAIPKGSICNLIAR